MSIKTICETYKSTKNLRIIAGLAGKLRGMGYNFDETADILSRQGVSVSELATALNNAEME